MSEEAVVFGTDAQLVGVVTDPRRRASAAPAVVLLNSGIIHRAGPCRVYVRLARALAADGHVVLRYDRSGVGDSPPRADNLPLDRSAVAEAREAMDHLQATRGVDRFLVAGICSGANFAFHTARADTRVAGALLVNTQGYSTEMHSYIGARVYWRRVLFRPASWWRAIRGKADYARMTTRLRGLLVRREVVASSAADIASEFDEVLSRGVDLRLIFTPDDPGLNYLQWILDRDDGKLARSLRVDHIPDSDHVFTRFASQERLLEIARAWAADHR